MLCPAGSYEYIRRFIVELSGAEGGHGPDAPSALPIYDLVAGSASGEHVDLAGAKTSRLSIR
jgi:hypothetical protein